MEHYTHVNISHMTISLFGWWVDRDWERITEGLHVLSSPTSDDGYARGIAVWWGTDTPRKFSHLSTIWFAQVRTDTVYVEITGAGPLVDQFVGWLSSRLGVPAANQDKREQPTRPGGGQEAARYYAAHRDEGINQDEVARLYGISVPTLRRHLRTIERQNGENER